MAKIKSTRLSVAEMLRLNEWQPVCSINGITILLCWHKNPSSNQGNTSAQRRKDEKRPHNITVYRVRHESCDRERKIKDHRKKIKWVWSPFDHSSISWTKPTLSFNMAPCSDPMRGSNFPLNFLTGSTWFSGSFLQIREEALGNSLRILSTSKSQRVWDMFNQFANLLQMTHVKICTQQCSMVVPLSTAT